MYISILYIYYRSVYVDISIYDIYIYHIICKYMDII